MPAQEDPRKVMHYFDVITASMKTTPTMGLSNSSTHIVYTACVYSNVVYYKINMLCMCFVCTTIYINYIYHIGCAVATFGL